jgi:hypothetical protein
MESTHCGEVGGEPFAVSCLKLLDEEPYVGGDDFFARLRLGCGGKGSNVAGFVRGGDAAQLMPHTTRIAANTFEEALEYLRWHQPRFAIDSVQNLGLIVLVSGSPLD